jgi:large subunit ribosomal protein L19
MQSLSEQIQAKYKKNATVDLKSGDTVRVHQKIVEGGKERIQIFEGLVIRVSRRGSLTQSFTVRRIASGVGVEKTYLIHSPNVLKVEVARRSKVRRNYLSYMRARTGKSARLTSVDFDRGAVNTIEDAVTENEEERIVHTPDAQQPKVQPEGSAKPEKTVEEAVEETKTEADKLEEQPVEKSDAKGPATPQNKA